MSNAKPKSKTQEFRERMAEHGISRLEVYAPEDGHEKIKGLAKRLTKRRLKGAPK